ncbi:MAG: hypothetical protein EBZ17_09935 [Actinobacteria bacterium]|nr:hypothetical protein [Actinomycetota bacterium]
MLSEGSLCRHEIGITDELGVHRHQFAVSREHVSDPHPAEPAENDRVHRRASAGDRVGPRDQIDQLGGSFSRVPRLHLKVAVEHEHVESPNS